MTVEIVERARTRDGIAVTEQGTNLTATYTELVAMAECIARQLLDGVDDLAGQRVACLVPSGINAVATLWGIWLAGGVAVPMALTHPRPELEHVVDDSDASLIIVAAELAERVEGLGGRTHHVEDLLAAPAQRAMPDVPGDRGALIIYTSGSTGRPKGALWTHDAIAHQVRTMVVAWHWQPDDVALLLLPIHHVHGLVNVLSTGLWMGASVIVADGFDPVAVWDTMESLTVLMAVPTIYHKLIAAHDDAEAGWQSVVTAAARKLRLMVSGSAALPVSVLVRWEQLTGHTLLERYGMTEIGMALTNPYEGPRQAGTVGRPFPGVAVRVVDEQFDDLPDGEDGQLLVRSAGMFAEYWQRPDATAAAFHDGWFLTGDVVVRRDGVFQIRGRMSVDIIKTSGFKVSALEVEEVLRTHPGIADCAVVGLPDEEYGEVIGVAVVPAPGATGGVFDEGALQDWMRGQLAAYKVPRRLRMVDDLPRNALGKVVKPRVNSEVFGVG